MYDTVLRMVLGKLEKCHQCTERISSVLRGLSVLWSDTIRTSAGYHQEMGSIVVAVFDITKTVEGVKYIRGS